MSLKYEQKVNQANEQSALDIQIRRSEEEKVEKDILKLQKQIKSKPRYTNGQVLHGNHLRHHLTGHERHHLVNNDGHNNIGKNQTTPQTAIPDQVRPSIIRTPQNFVPLGHNRRIVSYCWTKLEHSIRIYVKITKIHYSAYAPGCRPRNQPQIIINRLFVIIITTSMIYNSLIVLSLRDQVRFHSKLAWSQHRLTNIYRYMYRPVNNTPG